MSVAEVVGACRLKTGSLAVVVARLSLAASTVRVGTPDSDRGGVGIAQSGSCSKLSRNGFGWGEG